MKHPIYRDVSINKARELFLGIVKEQGVAYALDVFRAHLIRENEGLPEKKRFDPDLAMAQYYAFFIESKVAESGHVLINTESNEWSSTTSRRTIAMMRLKDFKFPFQAGTVMINDTPVSFCFGEIMGDGGLHLSFDTDYGLHTNSLDPDVALGELLTPDDGDTTQSEMAYDLMSVLLFVSTFDSTPRVKSVVRPRAAGSKKRSIPKHSVTTISLKQRVESSAGNGSKRGKSDKCWIVRGFWRNQFYAVEGVNKPKWIDSHWRGEGREEVEKVYKI